MQANKKICLLIPVLVPGGMERVMSELANFFSTKSNTEVHLILYGYEREIFYSLPEKLIIHKPSFEFNKNSRLYYTIKTFLYLRKQIKFINPDTTLSFGEYWNNFVILSLTGLNLPLFVSDRCQPGKSLGFLHNHLRKLLYPRVKGVISQTKVAKDIYLKQFNHSNIHVIGNPIRQVKTNSNCIVRENIVLTVGRLINSKNFDLLIDIFIKTGISNWKLVIVGGDAIQQQGMKRLTAKIKELHIEERVILTGNISNVVDYYLKSKIFAFTSSSEGFPNVIGEAMSAGLPVVAFDCIAGPSEMIKDGFNGYLVPLFDSEKFEQQLTLLMSDELLRVNLGLAAKKSIEKFSVESVGEAFYSFIMPQN